MSFKNIKHKPSCLVYICTCQDPTFKALAEAYFLLDEIAHKVIRNEDWNVELFNKYDYVKQLYEDERNKRI